MATSKPAAKKVAAKATPAPAPAPVEAEDTGAIEVGSTVRFLGYGEDVPEDQQYLTADEHYVVVGFTEPDPESGDPGGDPIVDLPNPDFNPKKKESEQNPKSFQAQVLMSEVELVTDEEGAEEAAGEEEAAAEEEVAEEAAPAPAPAPAKKPAAKTAPAKPAAKTAPAKTAGKKAAPAKAEKAAEEEAVDPDALPDLEEEDAEVLAMIENAENGDIIALGQQLESTAALTEYQLGGVLYHIKKDKLYLQVPGGEKYAEKGGWAEFLKTFYLVEYRKAQTLIGIYIAFSQAKIANASAVVASMGWAKAAKITPLLNIEGNDPTELIDLASNNTLADLSTTIKESVTVGATGGSGKSGGTRIQRITLKFRFEEGAAKMIDTVLKSVMETNSLKTLDAAMEYIVTDWASNNGIAVAKAAPAQGKAVGKPAAKSAPAKTAAPVAAKKAAPVKRVAA